MNNKKIFKVIKIKTKINNKKSKSLIIKNQNKFNKIMFFNNLQKKIMRF